MSAPYPPPPPPPTRFAPGDRVRVIGGPHAGTVTTVESELVYQQWLCGPTRGTWSWVHRLAIPLPPNIAHLAPKVFCGAEPHHLKPYREGDDPLSLSLEDVLEELEKAPSKERV